MTYRLVEIASSLDHLFVFLPRLVRVGDAELFDLLELMDTEDTPSVSAVGTSFFSEASRVTTIAQRQVLAFNDAVQVEGAERLFRSGNQIQVTVVVVASDFVELFIVLFQLSNLVHNISLHEEWGLNSSVLSLAQELQAVVDQGLVQVHGDTLQVVATVTGSSRASFGVVAVNHVHQLVVVLEPVLVGTFRAHNFVNTVIGLD